MEYEILESLLTRIKEEPSVLFLGQEYLRVFDGHDCFYEIINSQLCENKMPKIPNYQNIWDFVGHGTLSPREFKNISALLKNIPPQIWLRKMLSLRWGMIFTSSVDGVMANCTGPNFTLETIPQDTRLFQRSFVNKKCLHATFLYGSIDNSDALPPKECSTTVLRGLRKKINDRLDWIYNDILYDYGILVIEGWNPRSDWLSFLLHNATDMGYDSIYLFGVNDQTIQDFPNIAELIEDGIIHTESQTFSQVLHEHGVLDEENDLMSFQFGKNNDSIGKTITIRGNQTDPVYLNLPLLSLEMLDDSITVMHDDLEQNNPEHPVTSDNFALFLQQGDKPIWSLYNSHLGFCFHRDADEVLLETIHSELRKRNSSKRPIILIEGDSNSGKTIILAKLALSLKNEHHFPVIYINGSPTQIEFTENLKRFIKKIFLDRHYSGETGIDNIILIWDNNNESNSLTLRRYQQLAYALQECNVLLVGSAYQCDKSRASAYLDKQTNAYRIPVKSTLSSAESIAFTSMLKKVSQPLYELYVKLSKPSDHILYILQRIANYSYSSEWKKVAELLRAHFYQEVVISERDSQQNMRDYQNQLPPIEEVENVINEKGFAAAWQLELEIYRKEHFADIATLETKESIQHLLELNDDIVFLNQVLAMAGQFLIELPLTLLLRMIRKENRISCKKELFINQILQNDSLVRYYADDQGYAMVRFRTPSEAELYVRKNFGDDNNSLKDKEVKLLLAIIKKCRWEEEGRFVLALVRKFGPNSDGKILLGSSQKNFKDYIDWWQEIAETLKNYSEGNVEAILVYAHLMRETYAQSSKMQRDAAQKQHFLIIPAEILRDIRDNHDRSNKFQYSRIIVEICANLVATLSDDSCSFDRDIFSELQKNYNMAISAWIDCPQVHFTKNSLLDIWLNAIIKFKESFSSLDSALKNPLFFHALSDSLYYINRLLDINNSFDSVNLLSKIDEIYSWTTAHNLELIGDELKRQKNDTFLYLSACRCWLTGNPIPRHGSELVEYVKYNLFSIPDDADRIPELCDHLNSLKELAKESAEKINLLFAREASLVEESQSARCLEMMIKAKWLLYTNHFILEEKQLNKISVGKWIEINQLCRSYFRYCSAKKISPINSIRFIMAVYLWTYTDNFVEAKENFNILRDQMGYDWFIERIGLCSEETGELYQFYVDIKRNSIGKYTATIRTELSNRFTSIDGRSGIHVPERVMSYLFDAQTPRERYNIQKPVSLWFNAQGPTLGYIDDGKIRKKL